MSFVYLVLLSDSIISIICFYVQFRSALGQVDRLELAQLAL